MLRPYTYQRVQLTSSKPLLTIKFLTNCLVTARTCIEVSDVRTPLHR